MPNPVSRGVVVACPGLAGSQQKRLPPPPSRPCTSFDVQYTRNCMSLMGQIRSHEDALKAAGHIESVSKFVADVRMNCPHALERIKTGVAATVVVPSHDSRPSAAIVAETVRACQAHRLAHLGWCGAV
jgi:hypothetical protein